MKVLDDRAFGWRPVVGSHVMKLSSSLCMRGSSRKKLGGVARGLSVISVARAL